MFNPQINQVIKWLTQKFREGASYGVLNTSRSAVSLICGDRVGGNPIITRLLKGAFNQRPARPKYQRIFSLDIVLRELEKLHPLESLNQTQLTEKLVVLLAIVTAHRRQTLSFIRISNIQKTTNGYEIAIPDRIKTTRPGSFQPLLSLPTFKKNIRLCVTSTLERYLAVTKDIRGNMDSLFLTTRKPFREASKDTISRWIRAFLVKSGVDEQFSAHSIRHAATSAASKKGVDINIIKNLARWSHKSKIFDKFYNRPIINKNNIFAETILS